MRTTAPLPPETVNLGYAVGRYPLSNSTVVFELATLARLPWRTVRDFSARSSIIGMVRGTNIHRECTSRASRPAAGATTAAGVHAESSNSGDSHPQGCAAAFTRSPGPAAQYPRTVPLVIVTGA